jgi:hypothetical protein
MIENNDPYSRFTLRTVPLLIASAVVTGIILLVVALLQEVAFRIVRSGSADGFLIAGASLMVLLRYFKYKDWL